MVNSVDKTIKSYVQGSLNSTINITPDYEWLLNPGSLIFTVREHFSGKNQYSEISVQNLAIINTPLSSTGVSELTDLILQNVNIPENIGLPAPEPEPEPVVVTEPAPESEPEPEPEPEPAPEPFPSGTIRYVFFKNDFTDAFSAGFSPSNDDMRHFTNYGTRGGFHENALYVDNVNLMNTADIYLARSGYNINTYQSENVEDILKRTPFNMAPKSLSDPFNEVTSIADYVARGDYYYDMKQNININDIQLFLFTFAIRGHEMSSPLGNKWIRG